MALACASHGPILFQGAWHYLSNFMHLYMTEREKELKNFLMKVTEESEKVDLKFNIQKTKIMASGLIISWQVDGKK